MTAEKTNEGQQTATKFVDLMGPDAKCYRFPLQDPWYHKRKYTGDATGQSKNFDWKSFRR